MKVKDILLNRDYTGLLENGPINIVVLGDSITHGAQAPGVIDYENVYWNRLKKKLNKVRNYVPVNMINSGIGGTTAKQAVCRIERDVLKYNPDLTIICFGLNDINGTLSDYIESLKVIFDKLKVSGHEFIFMTPNMLNTYVPENVDKNFIEYAAKTAEFQVGGKMDEYMNAAVDLCKSYGIRVCDCYNKWKEMYINGTDTTVLLANGINHPVKKMHKLFADMLFDLIMK